MGNWKKDKFRVITLVTKTNIIKLSKFTKK